MNNAWAQFVRGKFDTILLLCVFGYLLYRADPSQHEVLGALLLALTGSSRSQPSPPPTDSK